MTAKPNSATPFSTDLAKYFVAHLLTGDAKTYHERLTRELASRYRVFPLHERVVPHITIKAPFECDETGIKEVERVLRSFTHNENATPFSIQGFGRFGFRTTYLNVYRSPEAVSFVRRAIRVVNENVPWISKAPLEGNKLHASVARFMTRTQSRRVARHLAEEAPRFESVLDNIAILRKDNRAWVVDTVVPLRIEAPVFSTAEYEEAAALAV